MTTGWLYLFGAVTLEIMGTANLKLSEGFTKPIPSLLIIIFYGLSMVLFAIAVKYLDLGIAYAKLNKTNEAINELRRACRLQPDFPDSFFIIG